MLKWKNFRSLFIVLGVIMLIFVSVSCNIAAPIDEGEQKVQENEGNTPDDEQNVQDNDGQQNNGDGQQNSNDNPENLTAKFSAHFTAEVYIQEPGMSSWILLNIRVENGKIYIDDELYKISTPVLPEVTYTDAFLSEASRLDTANGNEEITNTLEKIKNADFCYLLEPSQDIQGLEIYVYEIDNILYLAQMPDAGLIARIHSVPIQDEANNLAEKLSANFTADTYFQESILSSWFSLDVKIENSKIYINDVLYKISTPVPPEIVYADSFLSEASRVDEANGNDEISSTLEKIKNADFCYLLESTQEGQFSEKYVYIIDNVFYFVHFLDGGIVTRIHSAPIL